MSETEEMKAFMDGFVAAFYTPEMAQKIAQFARNLFNNLQREGFSAGHALELTKICLGFKGTK